MANDKFEPHTFDTLKHYVYALFDPQGARRPFYVGKGYGNRVFQHAKGQYSEVDSRTRKQASIDKIQGRGDRVVHQMVAWGLDEGQAFLLEAALIQVLNRGADTAEELLLNVIDGQGQKMTDTRDLALEMHAQPLCPSDDRCMIVKLTEFERDWARDGISLSSLTRDQIWAACRGDWNLNLNRAMEHPVLLPVAKSIILDAFYVDGWERVEGRFPIVHRAVARNQAKEAGYRERYVGKSVAHLFPKGARGNKLYLPRPTKLSPEQQREEGVLDYGIANLACAAAESPLVIAERDHSGAS